MEKKNNSMIIACPKCGKPVATLNRTRETEGVFRAAEQHHCDCEHGTSEAPAASVCVTIETPTVVKSAETKADRRLNALRKAGIDVSGYTALNGILIRISTSGIPEAVADDDPVFNGILIDGGVPARELFNRWIPSQLMAALGYKPYRSSCAGGYTEWLKSHGYEYFVRALLGRLKFAAACQLHGDDYNYEVINTWLPKKKVVYILMDDLENCRKYVDGLKTKKCKGRPYKAVKGFGNGVFVDELEAKVFNPIARAISKVDKATSALDIYRAVKAWSKVRVNLAFDTAMPAKFVDAYKGIGAFYTLRDLILFEGMLVFTTPRTKLTKNGSMAYIEARNRDFAKSDEGYKLLGFLKQFLAYNGCDPAAKLSEWRKRSEARRAGKL